MTSIFKDVMSYDIYLKQKLTCHLTYKWKPLYNATLLYTFDYYKKYAKIQKSIQLLHKDNKIHKINIVLMFLKPPKHKQDMDRLS